MAEWLPTLLLGLLLVIVAYRLRRRYRKMVGEQPYKPIGLTIRWSILCALAIVMAGLAYLRGPLGLLAIPAGVGLGVYAFRTTTWDVRDDGVFYTPNSVVNLSVFALILARIGHRMATMLAGGADQMVESYRATRSPVTTAIFLFVLCYFLVESGLILVTGWNKRRQKLAADDDGELPGGA